MRLFIIGRHGPFPPPGGASSGYLIAYAGKTYALDMGSGVFARLCAEIQPEKLSALFLSHLHFDHIADLGVLKYCLEQSLREDRLAAPLAVYVPDVADPILSPYASEALCFQTMPDSLPLEACTAFRFDTLHPVPCYGLRFVSPEKTIAYTADSQMFPALIEHCAHASLLLCDGCLLEKNWSPAAPHMSLRQAGLLAREAKAKRLLLTHIHPYADRQTVVTEAMAEFPDTLIVEEGAWYE